MPDSYDKYGNRIHANIHQMSVDKLYHRFEPGVGDECKTCGNDRFSIAHFNGDKTAAGLARQRHHEIKQALNAWRSRLKVGDRVQISDNHPRDDLRGRTGTVVAFTEGSQNPLVKDRIVSVKMTKVASMPPVELAFPAHFLVEPQVQVKVPKFDSPEEADRWLEDTAKEMGIVPERDTPYFATKEEADEWLAQQERIANKEPWLPPSWRDDNIQAQGAMVMHAPSQQWNASNPVLSAGEVGIETDTGITKIGDGHTFWSDLPKVVTHPQSGNKFQGQQPQHFVLDELTESQAAQAREEIDKRIFDLLQEAIPPGSTGASEANDKLTPDDIRATIERLGYDRLGIQVTKPEDIIRITGI